MAVVLTDTERAALKAFVMNEEEDPEGSWNWFHASVTSAVKGAGGSELETDGICRNLRKRKLLIGSGSGKWASYYPSDKAREALGA